MGLTNSQVFTCDICGNTTVKFQHDIDKESLRYYETLPIGWQWICNKSWHVSDPERLLHLLVCDKHIVSVKDKEDMIHVDWMDEE